MQSTGGRLPASDFFFFSRRPRERRLPRKRKVFFRSVPPDTRLPNFSFSFFSKRPRTLGLPRFFVFFIEASLKTRLPHCRFFFQSILLQPDHRRVIKPYPFDFFDFFREDQRFQNTSDDNFIFFISSYTILFLQSRDRSPFENH